MTEQELLIFLHIPKAGGMTLGSILERIYGSRATYSAPWTGVGHDTIGDFMRLPVERAKTIRLIKGHMFFGLHEHVPVTARYVTMLRSPVDRIISHYHHVWRTPSHPDHEIVTSSRMTIAEYIRSETSVELDNFQTRLLAGITTEIAFGDCRRELLQRAVDHVKDHFAVAGLTERFDETLLLLKSVLGWRTVPCYIRANEDYSLRRNRRVSDATIDLIRATNRLDIELYDFVTTLFNERAAERLAAGELQHFRWLNAAYGLPNNLGIKPMRRLWKRLRPCVARDDVGKETR